MPSETVQAIVLRYANYRDHDRMLTLLSPSEGRMDVLARGCRRPKSPLLAGSELFVHGEFVLFHTGDRYTLSSCTIMDSFYGLRLDPYRLTCASYLLELAQAVAQPNQEVGGLFALLLEGLYHLTYCAPELPLAVVSSFLLLYANEIGYRPRLNHCVHCGKLLPLQEGARMDIEAGGLCCPQCAQIKQYPLDAKQVFWMRNFHKMKDGINNDAADLFVMLRRYVEGKIDTPIKAGKFLP